METALPPPPDLSHLTEGLSSVLQAAGETDGQITVIGRERHDQMSMHPSEVVTCRTRAGATLRLLCKYPATRDHSSYGHRGGISHEAEVYRSVLQPISVSAPRCFGTYDDPATGRTCLVIEFLDGAQSISKVDDGPERAAEWLGRFHAINESRLSNPSLKFLTRYDRAYYRGWIDRTIQFASPLEKQFPWLADLLRQSDEIIDTLQVAPVTVIHGEYYPHNVLLRDGLVAPVDWESAAVAPGEIDLASLTQNWPEVDAPAWDAYCRVRWPSGSPPTAAKTLQAARIYFEIRWLGDEPNWGGRAAFIQNRENLRRYLEQWDCPK